MPFKGPVKLTAPARIFLHIPMTHEGSARNTGHPKAAWAFTWPATKRNLIIVLQERLRELSSLLSKTSFSGFNRTVFFGIVPLTELLAPATHRSAWLQHLVLLAVFQPLSTVHGEARVFIPDFQASTAGNRRHSYRDCCTWGDFAFSGGFGGAWNSAVRLCHPIRLTEQCHGSGTRDEKWPAHRRLLRSRQSAAKALSRWSCIRS